LRFELTEKGLNIYQEARKIKSAKKDNVRFVGGRTPTTDCAAGENYRQIGKIIIEIHAG